MVTPLAMVRVTAPGVPMKVPLVPFLLEGVAEKPELFQPDQLHPTRAAQPAILDNVWKVLEPLLRRK